MPQAVETVEEFMLIEGNGFARVDAMPSLYQNIKFLGALLAIVIGTTVIHYCTAFLYYYNCSRSILSVLLFKRSDICVSLHLVTTILEQSVENLLGEFMRSLKG